MDLNINNVIDRQFGKIINEKVAAEYDTTVAKAAPTIPSDGMSKKFKRIFKMQPIKVRYKEYS